MLEMLFFAVMQPYNQLSPSPVTVGYYQIDTNHHVNNAQYIEMARQAAGDAGRIRELRAEYKKAAVLGDKIIPRISSGEGRETIISLCSQDGRPYAVVWMDYMPQGAK